jgi:hypothetical protein
MQLIVVSSSNIPVNVQVGTSVQRNTTNPIYINVGETLTFGLNAFNVDNGSVSVTTGGSALLNTTATSNSTSVSNNEIISTVNWTPTLSEVRDEPYYLSFRIGDYSVPYTFYNDYTFRVIITNNTTGISGISPKKGVFLVKTIDILGREIDNDSSGFKIQCFSDGTTKKIYSMK